MADMESISPFLFIMKSARITFLGTPEFKAALEARAKEEGISVGELVRRQFEGKPSEEEVMLQALSNELLSAVAEARMALNEGLVPLRRSSWTYDGLRLSGLREVSRGAMS